MTRENVSKLAHKIEPGDTVEIHPRDWVTVGSVDAVAIVEVPAPHVIESRMFDPAPDGWDDYELVNAAQEQASVAAHQSACVHAYSEPLDADTRECYDCGLTYPRGSQ